MGESDYIMVRRDFGKDPMTEDEVLKCHWYAVIDNTIGGWSISNVDQSVAELNPYEGRFELGSFLTESEAKHIAKIHNDWWDIQVWGTYMSNIAWSFNQADSRVNVDKWWYKS